MEIRYIKRTMSAPFAGQEGDHSLAITQMPGFDGLLSAAPGGGSGGGKPSEEKASSDTESEKTNTTGHSRAKDESGSITDADTPLTGDTGNMELGQTDLGASGTGAEDPLADEAGERE
jgi:hypothetical protein